MAERETAVLGVFNNRAQAEICIDTLWNAGFRNDDMSVLASDRRVARELTAEKHTKTEHPADDAEVGATLGIEIGAGLGLLAGFAVLGIPGLGAFVAAGPILGTLMGAGIGAAGGGVIGALIGWGISEHDAHRYHERLKAGGILLAVHSDSPDWRDKARDILERTGAQDIAFRDEELLGLHMNKEPEPAYRG